MKPGPDNAQAGEPGQQHAESEGKERRDPTERENDRSSQQLGRGHYSDAPTHDPVESAAHLC